jgi:hypothetical protein
MIYEVGMNSQSCSCQMRPHHSQDVRRTLLSYCLREVGGGKLPLIGRISCQEVPSLFLLCILTACCNWNMGECTDFEYFISAVHIQN